MLPIELILRIAIFSHPYDVSQTLFRLNRAFYAALHALPATFANENLKNIRVSHECEVHYLNWKRLSPTYLAVLAWMYNFSQQAELNQLLAKAVGEAMTSESLNALRMFFEFPKDRAYNPRKGIRVPGPRAALASGHRFKSVEVMRVVFSEPSGNLLRYRRKLVSRISSLHLELVPTMLEEFCTPDDVLGELDTFLGISDKSDCNAVMRMLDDERVEIKPTTL
ncbi:hypothetical protein HDU96_006112 [Phlyctochytrium bullatum]|nr:hypothetical protein HDU96_006112 [Phlyctochytrium bullatum]